MPYGYRRARYGRRTYKRQYKPRYRSGFKRRSTFKSRRFSSYRSRRFGYAKKSAPNGSLNLTKFLTTPFPDTCFFKHRYVYATDKPITALPVPADGYFNYAIMGNALYQPGPSPSTFGAQFRIEMAQLYTTYRVFAAKIRVKIWNTGTSVTPFDNRMFLCLYADLSSAQPTVTRQQMLMNTNARVVHANCEKVQKLSLYRTTADMFGVPASEISEDANYASASGTQPGAKWYLHFLLAPEDTVNTHVAGNCNIRYEIKVTYYTRWENRIEQYDD